MSDLVKRLRIQCISVCGGTLHEEAADKIERLTAERDALREAWADLVDYPDYVIARRARALLNKGGGDE